jgi:hypothetical protein
MAFVLIVFLSQIYRVRYDPDLGYDSPSQPVCAGGVQLPTYSVLWSSGQGFSSLARGLGITHPGPREVLQPPFPIKQLHACVLTEDSIVIRPSPYNLLLAVVSVVHSFEFRPFTSSSLLVGTRLEHHVQHIQQLPVPRRTQCFREHVTALRVRGLLHNPVHRVRNSIPK